MTPERLSLDRLATAARRVTGGDGAVVALAAAEGWKIASAAGWEPHELEAVQASLGPDLEQALRRSFSAVRGAAITVEERVAGCIHVVRRTGSGFDNADLIDTFAMQAGLALTLGHRPPVLDEMLETWALLDQLVPSAHSFRELSQALVDVVGPLFGDATIGVMLADPQRYMLQSMAGAFAADDGTVASHRVSFFDRRSNSSRVFTTGLPYMSNAAAGDRNIRQEYVGVFGIERIMTVPLGSSGVLHVANGRAAFTVEDLERAMRLAPRIGSIVELAVTIFRTRRERKIEEAIARVAVAVASGESIHSVLPPAFDVLRDAIDAGLVAFVPDDAEPIASRSDALPRAQEEAVLDEAGTEPGVRAYVVGPQKAGDTGWAAFYVPVALEQQRVGTLAALRVRGEPFTQFERQSLVRMANVTSLSYATERYQQQRAELARLHERQRLADALHDDVAQILFAAQLSLDSLLVEDSLDPDLVDRVARARGLLIRGDTAIRTVIHGLAGPPAADITLRLGSAVAEVEDEFAIAVHLHVGEAVAQLGRQLRRAASDALVRAAREALVNAAKHAGPCRISVTLDAGRTGDDLVLSVVDDGLGRRPAGPAAGRHGLVSMEHAIREQGGDVRMPWRERGTIVIVRMPVRTDRPRARRGGRGAAGSAPGVAAEALRR